MKDKLHKDLAIGDRVVFNPPSYKGLVFGHVIGFTPKMVRLEYMHQMSLNETRAFYSDVVKVEPKKIIPLDISSE